MKETAGGIWVSGFRTRVKGLGLKVLGLGLRVLGSGFGHRVSGVGNDDRPGGRHACSASCVWGLGFGAFGRGGRRD
jgi:hypothetical protein